MHITTPIYTHTPLISLPTGVAYRLGKVLVPRNGSAEYCKVTYARVWPAHPYTMALGGCTVQPGLGLHTLYPQQPYFVQALIPTYTHIHLDKPHTAIPNYTHNNTHT